MSTDVEKPVRFFNEWAALYDLVMKNIHDYDHDITVYTSMLQTHLPFDFTECPPSLLEVGCGAGRIPKKLLRSFHCRYVGLDNSPQMLHLAQQRCEGTTAEFVEGDMRYLEKSPELGPFLPFDAVLNTGCTFSFLRSRGDILRCLLSSRRVLHPTHGILVIETFEAGLVFGPGGMKMESDWGSEFSEDTFVDSNEQVQYKRVSRKKRCLESPGGWSWEWESKWSKRGCVEEGGEEEWEDIGGEVMQLRAHLKDEVELLFRLAGFEVVEATVDPKRWFLTVVGRVDSGADRIMAEEWLKQEEAVV